MILHSHGLCDGGLCSFIHVKVSHPCLTPRAGSLTLTRSPAQPDPAALDGKTLHLFNCPLGIRFADELNKTAISPSRDLDLHGISTVSHGSEFYLTKNGEHSECHQTVRKGSLACPRKPKEADHQRTL